MGERWVFLDALAVVLDGKIKLALDAVDIGNAEIRRREIRIQYEGLTEASECSVHITPVEVVPAQLYCVLRVMLHILSRRGMSQRQHKHQEHNGVRHTAHGTPNYNSTELDNTCDAARSVSLSGYTAVSAQRTPCGLAMVFSTLTSTVGRVIQTCLSRR